MVRNFVNFLAKGVFIQFTLSLHLNRCSWRCL